MAARDKTLAVGSRRRQRLAASHRSLQAAVLFVALASAAMGSTAEPAVPGLAPATATAGATATVTAANNPDSRRVAGFSAAGLLKRSAQASLAARESCQRLMHEDAVEFRKCADSLLAQNHPKATADRYDRLGIAYYAWLSSTSAAKNGLPAAQQSALHFLGLFRPLQRALHVEDRALCTTIPGDCTARLARLALMEQELAAHPTAADAPPAPSAATVPSGAASRVNGRAGQAR